MKLDYVSIEKRDGVAIVRFDRKANLNAFNEKLVVELTRQGIGRPSVVIIGVLRPVHGHVTTVA